jgi:hypothetical protein
LSWKLEDIMTPKIMKGHSLLDAIHLTKVVQIHLKNGLNSSDQEFIEAAETAIKNKPDDWVILYELGERYPDVGRYADALTVARQCVKLRPKDIKSVFLLATTYNLLTRAWWTKESADVANRERGVSGSQKIDPELAKAELIKAELTLEMAAHKP